MAKINKITLEDAKVLEEALKIAKKIKKSCTNLKKKRTIDLKLNR